MTAPALESTSLAALIMPVSPVLAAGLAGKSAPLALSALGKALLGDDQATPTEIITAVTQGGDAAKLKIRMAEEQLLRNLDASGTSLTALSADDTKPTATTMLAAKDREAADARYKARDAQSRSNDYTNSRLAYGVTIGFFAVVLILALFPYLYPVVVRHLPPVDGKPATAIYDPGLQASLQTLLGVLGTGWVAIMTYYFGSSVGSKEKSALLEESVVAKNAPMSVPPSVPSSIPPAP